MARGLPSFRKRFQALAREAGPQNVAYGDEPDYAVHAADGVGG